MGRFTGKVVLVTGALGGIGSATARRFAAEGALLALTDIGKTADDVPAALDRLASGAQFGKIVVNIGSNA